MRVALVTNALDAPTSGNCTTVQRWLGYGGDIQMEAVPADPDQVLDPVPDVIHGYHARHGGIAALQIARRYRRPLVVSIGGTDLYEMVRGQDEGGRMAAVLRAAQCVTGAFESFGKVINSCLGREVPYLVVPRGAPLSGHPRPRPPDGTLRVLLAAGLRPVKAPLLAIDLAGRLVARGLPLRLRILGSTFDPSCADQVRAAAHTHFVELGEVPHEQMTDAYRSADVVWNTSAHEGGSNALLEAVAEGCALFVRDAPGNRELLANQSSPGMLFHPDDLDGAEGFHRRLLAETRAEREERATRGMEWLRAHHSPAAEARALVAAWHRARSGWGSRVWRSKVRPGA